MIPMIILYGLGVVINVFGIIYTFDAQMTGPLIVCSVALALCIYRIWYYVGILRNQNGTN